MNTHTLTQLEKTLDENPLLAVIYRGYKGGYAGVNENIWFKSEVIAHGGFVGSDRKDIKACASYIHTNIIY